MPALLALLRRLGQAPALLAALALAALMVLTFADVILRSAFNAPIQEAAELTRLLMAIIVFAALPAVGLSDRHITVDLTDSLFSRRMARLRDFVVQAGCGAILFWPAERVWVLAERARSYGDVTEYLAIPQFWPTAFIAAATAVAGLAMVARGLMVLFAPGLLARVAPTEPSA